MAGLQKLEAELHQEVHVLLGLHIDSRPLNNVCLVRNRPAELKSYISGTKTNKLFFFFFCLRAKSIAHLNSCKSDKGPNEKSQRSEESRRVTLAFSVLLHYIRMFSVRYDV